MMTLSLLARGSTTVTSPPPDGKITSPEQFILPLIAPFNTSAIIRVVAVTGFNMRKFTVLPITACLSLWHLHQAPVRLTSYLSGSCGFGDTDPVHGTGRNRQRSLLRGL